MHTCLEERFLGNAPQNSGWYNRLKGCCKIQTKRDIQWYIFTSFSFCLCLWSDLCAVSMALLMWLQAGRLWNNTFHYRSELRHKDMERMHVKYLTPQALTSLMYLDYYFLLSSLSLCRYSFSSIKMYVCVHSCIRYIFIYTRIWRVACGVVAATEMVCHHNYTVFEQSTWERSTHSVTAVYGWSYLTITEIPNAGGTILQVRWNKRLEIKPVGLQKSQRCTYTHTETHT